MIQARLEATTWGRAAISALLVVTLVCLVVWNLPDSHVRREALPAVRTFMHATGLEQDWHVFAPDPRQRVLDLSARISYADGTTETWRFPQGHPFLPEYREYRWQKYMESQIQDARSELWRPFAAWIAREHDDGGRRVQRVVLVRSWFDLAAPGADEARDWQSYEYFTYDVPGGTGAP